MSTKHTVLAVCLRTLMILLVPQAASQSFIFDPPNVVIGCDAELGCPSGKEIEIPSDNNGVAVTEVGERAFRNYQLT
ncbi:hypothetical protein [uncultured Pseudoteredinibacter sp.]|uniref:hypothetical protein n=1 Tax=uncultured Pseudoteredinibacter sp. TaxID=1641701 RepID=UPI00262A6A0C|nr:hypothetical protein [uncultured Pseudoteredinibacter sp.]